MIVGLPNEPLEVGAFNLIFNNALQRLEKGDVKYRFVVDMQTLQA